MKIALDAMGGDHAPHEVLKGAIAAVGELPVEIVLVGQESVLRQELSKLGVSPTHPQLKILHAPDVVEMSESPSLSFKRKKASSIRLGLDLVKEGKADAFVSAGNTGAVMAASTLILGRIQGVERPAIATLLPTLDGRVVMLDMGSNVDCKPSHLLQFGVMGHFFSRLILGVAEPRVGLLNIGEEEDKGDQLALATFPLLKAAPIRFIGNIESKEILFDKVDVVVCDGFVGNNLLKFGEGVAEFFYTYFKRECKKSILAMAGALLMLPVIKRFRKKTDYEEFGGAPLLGVNGVSIIAHGKSKSKAIKNAIRTAVNVVESGMVNKIADAVANVTSATAA